MVLFLAVLGGTVKIAGGVIYGSRSLLVDALTSFANIVSIGAVMYYYRLSQRPPDADHHYGHERLGYAGVLATMLSYSFVAGVSSSLLALSTEYSVEFGSVYTAILGFIIYAAVVAAALKVGGFFKTYGAFTVSELIESIVVIVAAGGGALVSYLIDYAGAVVLTIYIFYELKQSYSELILFMSDTAPPASIVDNILSVIKDSGLEIKRYRFRIVSRGRIHGDIIIAHRPGMRVEDELAVMKRVKKIIEDKHRNTDIIIELDYGERG